MEETIIQIKTQYLDLINQSTNLKDLDKIFLELFGKNGAVTALPKQFSKLSSDDLKKVGPLFNKVKVELEQTLENKRAQVREKSYEKLESETFDLDAKVEIKTRVGHLHPLTIFEKKIADLFRNLGFQQFDGPEIDTDLNNFELLNIPPDHPARDMWDTLYIDNKTQDGEKILLRTHTSNSQIHVMKNNKPPFKVMIIGRCFRYEAVDSSHEHTFDQFEIVYVDKKASMANLQYLSEYFLKAMLGEDIKARLSPGYYPFTEPSAHIFGTCVFCKGQGCPVCAKTGELELAGAGMIHPRVLENCGIDSKVYSGIAWGVGPGRMAMLKYNIKDVRLFNSGDLKFLESIK